MCIFHKNVIFSITESHPYPRAWGLTLRGENKVKMIQEVQYEDLYKHINNAHNLKLSISCPHIL